MRGFNSAVPYVRVLLNTNDVVILTEHWLHADRLNRLEEILDSISYCAKSSKFAAAENYGSHRGQGGVAILWKSALSGISEVKSILHDRICGLRVQSVDGSVILIYGVYLQARGSPEDFNSAIDDFVKIIDSREVGAECIIVGDVNCDLGNPGGCRSLRPAYDRGRILKEILDKYNLFACNLDSRALGPVDTYYGPTGSSTIDYICIPRDPVSLFTSCVVSNNDPLNASDHEAVSVVLDLEVLRNRATTVVSSRLPPLGQAFSRTNSRTLCKTCQQ